MQKSRLAIFASGSGSNAEAICQYFQNHPDIEVALLLSNKPDAPVLERMKKYAVETKTFNRVQFKENTTVLHWLQEKNITHIVLAGFLWLLPKYLIEAHPSKIINIHPALLPKYGGKGMYGMKIHETVKATADEKTGITIHIVNERYDEGEILFQASCTVEQTDTSADIAQKIHTLEHRFYPKVIEQWVQGG